MATVAVYLDESGTHDGSPWCIVAGHIGAAADWGQFTDDWNAILNRPEFGGVVFHAADMWAGHGAFEGWTRFKCFSLALHLARLLVKWSSRVYGLAVAIPVPDFNEIVAPTLPEGARAPYLSGLLLILFRILSVADRKFEASRVVCFADQKKDFEWRGQELYKIVRSQLGGDGGRLGEELNYRSKKSVVPLQAADFLAHSAFTDLKDLSVGGGGDPATGLVRAEIKLCLNRCFTERPQLIDRVILRALATGATSELERLAALEPPE